MNLDFKFMAYEEREYKSKKTGLNQIAQELTGLTMDGQILQFAYGNFAKDVGSETFADVEPGDTISLNVVIEPNRYDNNRPRVVITGRS